MHRFLLALALIVIVQPAAAQESDEAFGYVRALIVNETSFGVETDRILNPAGCPGRNSYRSPRELYYTTALTAFTMTALVTITIHRSECVDGQPKIVSMRLDRSEYDLPFRMAATLNHLATIEQRVNDLNNQTNQMIAQRADQALAQGNQIASKVDQVEQTVIRNFRQITFDPHGLSLMNLIDSIARKVGAL